MINFFKYIKNVAFPIAILKIITTIKTNIRGIKTKYHSNLALLKGLSASTFMFYGIINTTTES